jgi:hypothetical protein
VVTEKRRIRVRRQVILSKANFGVGLENIGYSSRIMEQGFQYIARVLLASLSSRAFDII